ncbi:MAG: cupin domain-containing protein [Candidatus Heimdallarchaeota archaeon]|nr:MAG: cupin [Candidatus Gerdarchaeota archaeon]RLI73246.1 MAG: cupin [Candidatus Heimdallarchaeota archaeon]
MVKTMVEKATVKKPTKEELEKLNIDSWGRWEKEVSEFPWEYHDKETFYVFEGKATVTLDDGQKVEFGKGDLVTFAKGVKCVWKIHEPIKKAYKFGE